VNFVAGSGPVGGEDGCKNASGVQMNYVELASDKNLAPFATNGATTGGSTTSQNTTASTSATAATHTSGSSASLAPLSLGALGMGWVVLVAVLVF